MNKYAIITSASITYLPYLNVLLNSIDYCKLSCDVHIMIYEDFLFTDYGRRYLDDIKNKFSFNIYIHQSSHKDIEKYLDQYDQYHTNSMSKNHLLKKIRWLSLDDINGYDAVCIVDADMMIVSPEFQNFFDLVAGTDKLIGCEEMNKWIINEKFRLNNKQIFEEPTKLTKFSCLVPLFFVKDKWEDVLTKMKEVMFCGSFNNSMFNDANEETKGFGDMFSFNIALHVMERHTDTILMPQNSFTQVNGSCVLPWSKLKFENDKWSTYGGAIVYSMHDRLDKSDWVNRTIKILENTLNSYKIYDGETRNLCIKRAYETIRKIQKHWWTMSFEHNVKIDDYMPEIKKNFMYAK